MSQMEKTEKASPFKLEKAKKRGQIAKSSELGSALSLLTILISLTVLWQNSINDIQRTMRSLLILAGQFHWSFDNICHLWQHLILQCLSMALPFMVIIALANIAFSLLQTGFIWSFETLRWDITRLNPINGFKRFLSIKLLFESGKQSLKLLLTIVLCAIELKHHLPEIVNLLHLSASGILNNLCRLALNLGFKIAFVLGLLSLVDLAFHRWKFAKDQRMSKQEIKDEYRQREGCPKIKAKVKQLQKELRARSASIKAIKNADVLITNPTHIAIALEYKQNEMPAPKVICKASGELAQAARKEAQRHNIQIIENKSFARALFHSVALNQYIDASFYPVAATIFRQIYQQTGTQG